MARGKVYIVGAGPGDPGLLTVRGKEVLSRAQAVVYDALVHPRILDYAPGDAQRIFRGSQGKKGALSQEAINALLVRLVRQGKNVVRLKGGDPFVFGRGSEEGLFLAKHKITFEVVPGVSSSFAVPAYAGIPVTHRAMNSSFTVVTGHEDPSKNETQVDWAHLAQDPGTLVFLMGIHNLTELCKRLIEEGKSPETPAAVIQWGTTSRQKTVLGNLGLLPNLVREAGLRPPATVVVGPVVSLSPELQWVSKKPLWGVRILVTRTPSKASYLSSLLTEEGAEVFEIPTIELKPVELDRRGRRILETMGSYDWIVFSSAYAVERLMDQLDKTPRGRKSLDQARLACVGEATANSLRAFGLKANLVPGDYKQEGLIQSFKKKKLDGKKILFVRAKEGRDLLIRFLQGKKAKVDLLALYENVVPAGAKERLQDLFGKEGGVDLVTFASSSSVDHFYSLFTPVQRRKWLKQLATAVIGPVTGATVRKWGGRVVVQPRKHTLPSLVGAISTKFRNRKSPGSIK
ncbi:MAG TPA: uroporphyrinogen-III C-methyltransferase [bacterium]|nr:uroporphyrinogen-III C-methyltransferase [bacterium]